MLELKIALFYPVRKGATHEKRISRSRGIMVGGSGNDEEIVGNVSLGPWTLIGGSIGGNDKNSAILIAGRGDTILISGDAKEDVNKKYYGLPGTGANALLIGGQGNDTLYGGAGNDTLIGGSFNPSASSGNDTIYAGDADSIIVAGNATTDSNGNITADTTTPGGGTVFGGAGHDLIHAGVGNNVLSAGTGPAVFDFKQPSGPEANGKVLYTINGGLAVDSLDFTNTTSSENITLTGDNSNGFTGFTPVTAQFSGTFSGIDSIVGSPATSSNSLTGENTNSTWTITSGTSLYEDNGTSRTLAFFNFETMNGGSGVDTFNVQSLALETNLNGQGGNDVYNVSSNAPTDTGNLDGINAPLNINAGNGTANRLIVSDYSQANSPNNNVILTSQQIENFAGPNKNIAITYAIAAGGAFSDPTIDPLTGKPMLDGILLRGSNIYGDNFTVYDTLGGNSFTEIQGNGGNDKITVNVDETKNYNLIFDGGAPTSPSGGPTLKVGDALIVNDVTKVNKNGIPIPAGSSEISDNTLNCGAVIHNEIADSSTTDINFHRVIPSQVDLAYLNKSAGDLDPTDTLATLTLAAANARIHKDILYNDVEVVQTSPNANQSFIQAMYHKAMRRDANNAEIAAWLPILTGPGGQAAVVKGIENLKEALTLVVKDWYTQYLGRNMNSSEGLQFVSYLQQGYTEETVESRFFNLPEYYQKAGGTTKGFINLIYQQTLNRAPSAAEMFSAVHSALPKTGRGGLAWLILNSIEYRTKVVIDDFVNVLDRNKPSNTAEQNEWNQELNSLVKSNLDLKSIRLKLMGSAEFFVFAD